VSFYATMQGELEYPDAASFAQVVSVLRLMCQARVTVAVSQEYTEDGKYAEDAEEDERREELPFERPDWS